MHMDCVAVNICHDRGDSFTRKEEKMIEAMT